MANRGYDNVTAEELAEFEADRLRDAEFEADRLRDAEFEEMCIHKWCEEDKLDHVDKHVQQIALRQMRHAEFEAMCLRDYDCREKKLDEYEHYGSHGAENDYSAGEVFVAEHVRLMAHATQKRLQQALDKELDNSAIARQELVYTLAGSDPHHVLARWDKLAAVRCAAAEDALLGAVDEKSWCALPVDNCQSLP
jgi:hypothetical protein